MKQKIVIRADGGTTIGMGHVMRCVAMADMLKNKYNIVFAIQEPAESVIRTIHSVTETILHLPLENDYEKDAAAFVQFLEPSDIVVADGYHFNTAYQKAIKTKGCKLVAIDDLHSWHQLADAVINHAAGIKAADYSTDQHTRLFLGPDFALLRKTFLAGAKRRERSAVGKIFISMGAADVNNLTQKFTESILGLEGISEIHLMLGAINPNIQEIDKLIAGNKQVNIQKHFNITEEELAKLLQHCDLAICPASSISMEAAAIGIGLVSGYTADNQKGILQGLKDKQATIDLGDLNVISKASILSALQKIDATKLNELIGNQNLLIDGKSPERIRKVFSALNPGKLQFRMATEQDAGLYYEWTIDPAVRSNSYHQDTVSYEQHVNWFKTKLASHNCSLYLFTTGQDVPAGQVRIEKGATETVIGISVDPAFRGKGLATPMLEMAGADYLSAHPGEKITAYIKTENTSSYNSFLKAGYGDEELVTVQGCKSYKLVKN